MVKNIAGIQAADNCMGRKTLLVFKLQAIGKKERLRSYKPKKLLAATMDALQRQRHCRNMDNMQLLIPLVAAVLTLLAAMSVGLLDPRIDKTNNKTNMQPLILVAAEWILLAVMADVLRVALMAGVANLYQQKQPVVAARTCFVRTNIVREEYSQDCDVMSTTVIPLISSSICHR